MVGLALDLKNNKGYGVGTLGREIGKYGFRADERKNCIFLDLQNLKSEFLYTAYHKLNA